MIKICRGAGGVSMCLTMSAKVGELPYRAGQSKERAKLTRLNC